MNTPNKLTLARMIATPIFMAVMLIDFKFHYLISLVLFIAASLTDMIDGKMARKYNGNANDHCRREKRGKGRHCHRGYN